MIFFRRALVSLLALTLGACATNPVTGKQDLVLMSVAQELALGQQAHQQTLQQYRVYNDPALQQYVDAVGQRLAGISHRTELRYTFTVLDSDEINAFALPGGYIYVTRGLLAYLNSEAELAAVLGHEIGHVTARHGVRQASSAQAASLGGGLLSVFFPQLGSSGLNHTLGLLGSAMLRGYGREHELEADRLGAGYLDASGYDRSAMFDVIRTLKNQELFDQKLAALEGRETRAYHGIFSTHPDNDTRLQEILADSAATDHGGERQRDRFLNQIDGLIFGHNPVEGVIVGNRFLHPALGVAFAFPAGWRSQNNSEQLLVSNPAQTAIMLVRLVPANNGVTPAALLQKSGISPLSRAETISPAGLPGIRGLAEVQIEGSRRPARVAAVISGRYGYVFVGFTGANQALGAFDQAFTSIPASFRALSATEKAGIQAQRLAVTRLKSAISWAALAQASPIHKLAQAQLMLLNASNDAGPAAGSRIKIVK